MKRLTISLAVMMLFFSPEARAWHNRGHMAVARVAWEKLVQDGLADEVTTILEGHPHKDVFLIQEQPAGVKKDEWMFVQAATWPDWIRRAEAPGLDGVARSAITKKYHHSAWHFVNLPYVHPSEANQFNEAMIRSQALLPELDAHGSPRHALAAIKTSIQQLQAANTSPEDKAVALCWILHLTGDLHQPLHGVALIGSMATFAPEQFLPPHGDEGGNRLAIRTDAANENAIELHTYWDALLVEDKPYPEVQGLVLSWLGTPELQRSAFDAALKKKDALAWADESLVLAKTVVYMDNNKFLDSQPLPPNHVPDDVKNLAAPVLSAGYQAKAEQLARQRIVLGGYRLADALSAAIQSAP